MIDERYVVNIETHDGVPIFRGRVNALGLSKIGELAQAAVIAEEEDPGPQLITLPDAVTYIPERSAARCQRRSWNAVTLGR